MARFLLVATSSALEGRDDEYNAWYDTCHLADLLALPGVKSGRRFDACPASPDPNPSRYLAIYEIEADNPGAVMAELGSRARSGQWTVSDALDRSAAQLWLWQER